MKRSIASSWARLRRALTPITDQSEQPRSEQHHRRRLGILRQITAVHAESQQEIPATPVIAEPERDVRDAVREAA